MASCSLRIIIPGSVGGWHARCRHVIPDRCSVQELIAWLIVSQPYFEMRLDIFWKGNCQLNDERIPPTRLLITLSMKWDAVAMGHNQKGAGEHSNC